MGLFDQVFNAPQNQAATLSTAEAFAAICLVAIAADGYLSEQENTEMRLLLSRMKLFSDYSSERLERTKDQLLNRLKQHGPGVLIEAAKSVLPRDLAPTAFAIATDLVLADGTVTVQEQAFLDDLYRILEIPADQALKIVEVITLKNQG
ncbi:MAG: tellurite resistance TerB family protein [Cyanobacteria bacterium J06632_22]